jgi:hypothetical protein
MSFAKIICWLQLSSVADDDSGSFVQVMETFQNIGPILDMSVVDLDKQGQDLVRLRIWMYICTCVYMYMYNVYNVHVIIVVHEMHGRIHLQLFCWPMTPLIIGLHYDHPHPSGSR